MSSSWRSGTCAGNHRRRWYANLCLIWSAGGPPPLPRTVVLLVTDRSNRVGLSAICHVDFYELMSRDLDGRRLGSLDARTRQARRGSRRRLPTEPDGDEDSGRDAAGD